MKAIEAVLRMSSDSELIIKAKSGRFTAYATVDGEVVGSSVSDCPVKAMAKLDDEFIERGILALSGVIS